LGLHLSNRNTGYQDGVDPIGTVLLLVKVDQLFSDLRMAKGVIISDGKSLIGILRQLPKNFPLSTIIIICPEHILLMYSFGFLGNTTFSEKSPCKKVSNPLNSLYKTFVSNFKVVISLKIRGVCIIHP
jgi:hypothetical protein